MTPGSLPEEFLHIRDLVDGINHAADYATMKALLDEKGFLFETVLITNATNKMYNFFSEREYDIQPPEGNPISTHHSVVLRIENGNTLKRLLLTTAARKYYESLFRELVHHQFKPTGQQNKSMLLKYTSVLFPGITISLSMVQTVKDGSVYHRFQFTVDY